MFSAQKQKQVEITTFACVIKRCVRKTDLHSIHIILSERLSEFAKLRFAECFNENEQR